MRKLILRKLSIGNPHLTPLAEDNPAVRVIDCHYR